MPRLLVVLVVLTALAGLATPAAAQQRAVRVTSTPSGAMVYVGDKEQGPVGVTPILLKLKPGEHGLIIELEGYTPVVQQVKVPKGKGPAIDVAVTLVPAVGALVVSGDAALGAAVRIDDVERGNVPLRVELEAGAHHVQVATEPPYEEFVEIKPGDERTLVVTLTPPPPPAPVVVDPGPARGKPLVEVRLGTELGWRRMRYEGADDRNTRAYEGGTVAGGRLDVVLAPWRLSRQARRLWPLALVVGGTFAPVADGAVPEDDATAEVYWRAMDLGLRYRLSLLKGRLAVGFEGGWSRNLYQFRVPLEVTLEARLPDVDYQLGRLGARVEHVRGPLTGWLALDNRIVFGGGTVERRYVAADIGGFGLRLGLLGRLLGERLEVGAEYALERYGWELTPYPPPANPERDPGHQATSATDTFHGVKLWVGSQY
jgi:hypothetical protein